MLIFVVVFDGFGSYGETEISLGVCLVRVCVIVLLHERATGKFLSAVLLGS